MHSHCLCYQVGSLVNLCCPLLTHCDEFCCQASHVESQQALQRRLEEVSEELRTTQSRNSSLQTTLDKAQQDSSTLSGQRLGKHDN